MLKEVIIMIGDVKDNKVLLFFLALSMLLLYSCSAPVSDQAGILGVIPEESQEMLQESGSQKPQIQPLSWLQNYSLGMKQKLY